MSTLHHRDNRSTQLIYSARNGYKGQVDTHFQRTTYLLSFRSSSEAFLFFFPPMIIVELYLSVKADWFISLPMQLRWVLPSSLDIYFMTIKVSL